jgi:hypothetical protein
MQRLKRESIQYYIPFYSKFGSPLDPHNGIYREFIRKLKTPKKLKIESYFFKLIRFELYKCIVLYTI